MHDGKIASAPTGDVKLKMMTTGVNGSSTMVGTVRGGGGGGGVAGAAAAGDDVEAAAAAAAFIFFSWDEATTGSEEASLGIRWRQVGGLLPRQWYHFSGGGGGT